MQDLLFKMAQFDLGREAAKRDRMLYNRAFPYGNDSDFGRGYWYEWNK